jgi:hypothetical protein
MTALTSRNDRKKYIVKGRLSPLLFLGRPRFAATQQDGGVVAALLPVFVARVPGRSGSLQRSEINAHYNCHSIDYRQLPKLAA